MDAAHNRYHRGRRRSDNTRRDADGDALGQLLRSAHQRMLRDSSPLDSRAAPTPSKLPSFPLLHDRSFRKLRSEIKSSDQHLGGATDTDEAEGSADSPPRYSRASASSPGSAESSCSRRDGGITHSGRSKLIQRLRVDIEDDLARFDFRYCDGKGMSVVSSSFLESLDHQLFSVFRNSVLQRHSAAADRALASYEAMERRLKAARVFPDSFNDERIRATAECDLRRPYGALNLPSIAQGVVTDMLRALKGGTLSSRIVDGIVTMEPQAQEHFPAMQLAQPSVLSTASASLASSSIASSTALSRDPLNLRRRASAGVVDGSAAASTLQARSDLGHFGKQRRQRASELIAVPAVRKPRLTTGSPAAATRHPQPESSGTAPLPSAAVLGRRRSASCDPPLNRAAWEEMRSLQALMGSSRRSVVQEELALRRVWAAGKGVASTAPAVTAVVQRMQQLNDALNGSPAKPPDSLCR